VSWPANIPSGLAGVVSESTAEAGYATITALRDQLRQCFDADGQAPAMPPPPAAVAGLIKSGLLSRLPAVQ
jgi:hypothetical protein